MTMTELLIAALIAVGIAGILVPVLPGSILVIGAILAWTLEIGSPRAWVVFAIAATFVVAGTVVKYALPGRRLKASGVPTSTMMAGAALGFVGFFVVPVIGLLLGFLLGVYLAERRRVGSTLAWPSTQAALRAVGVSILIEFVAASLAAATWLVGVSVTG